MNNIQTENGITNVYMTPDELAKSLKVSKAFIYGRVHQKRIPFRKIGNRVRFKPDEIDQWIASGEASGEITESCKR